MLIRKVILPFVISFFLFPVAQIKAEIIHPDETFGTNGRTIFEESVSNVFISLDFKADSSGNLFYLGQTPSGTVGYIFSYLPSGQLNTAFGNNGILEIPDASMQAMVLDSEGNIFVAGSRYITSNDIVVMKFDQSGSLDTEFSGDGIFLFDYNNGLDLGFDISLQPSGNIIVLGTSSKCGYDTILLQVNSTGNLVPSFGNQSPADGTSCAASGNPSRLRIDSTGSIYYLTEREIYYPGGGSSHVSYLNKYTSLGLEDSAFTGGYVGNFFPMDMELDGNSLYILARYFYRPRPTPSIIPFGVEPADYIQNGTYVLNFNSVSGELDTNYNNGAEKLLSPTGSTGSLYVRNDHKLNAMITESTGNSFKLFQIMPEGSFDNNFFGGGFFNYSTETLGIPSVAKLTKNPLDDDELYLAGGVNNDGNLKGIILNFDKKFQTVNHSENLWIYADSTDKNIGTNSPDGVDNPYETLKIYKAGRLAGYNENQLDTNLFSENGTAQGWKSDEEHWSYDLPFTFTFYGQEYNSMLVSSNGGICFDLPSATPYCLDYEFSGLTEPLASTAYGPIIAPLAYDFDTSDPGLDIYVNEILGTNDDYVTIRWQTAEYATANYVNFSVDLHQNGKIVFHYGSQTSDIYQSVVGISAGDGVNYLESSISGTANFDIHNSVEIEYLTNLPAYLIAEVPFDMTADRDFSSVTGDIDLANLKSFIHQLSSVEGYIGPITLYVPYREGDKQVGICPGASTLDSLNTNCPGLTGKNEGDIDTSIVEIDGIKYWKVTGLTGTGGFSSNLVLTQTGENYLAQILFAAILLITMISKALLTKLRYHYF